MQCLPHMGLLAQLLRWLGWNGWCCRNLLYLYIFSHSSEYVFCFSCYWFLHFSSWWLTLLLGERAPGGRGWNISTLMFILNNIACQYLLWQQCVQSCDCLVFSFRWHWWFLLPGHSYHTWHWAIKSKWLSFISEVFLVSLTLRCIFCEASHGFAQARRSTIEKTLAIRIPQATKHTGKVSVFLSLSKNAHYHKETSLII